MKRFANNGQKPSEDLAVARCSLENLLRLLRDASAAISMATGYCSIRSKSNSWRLQFCLLRLHSGLRGRGRKTDSRTRRLVCVTVCLFGTQSHRRLAVAPCVRVLSPSTSSLPTSQPTNRGLCAGLASVEAMTRRLLCCCYYCGKQKCECRATYHHFFFKSHRQLTGSACCSGAGWGGGGRGGWRMGSGGIRGRMHFQCCCRVPQCSPCSQPQPPQQRYATLPHTLLHPARPHPVTN